MALSVSLAVTKINSTVVSETVAINPDNVKTVVTLADGTVVISVYDALSAKLVEYQSTQALLDVYTLYAAMDGKQLIKAFTIGAATLNRGMIINLNSIAAQVGTANPYLIEYDLGERNHVNKKSISAFVNAATLNLAITAVSVANKTFTVAGDQTATFVAGQPFIVAGSTGNDKIYTTVSSAFGAATVITVYETVLSAVADGNIRA